MFIFSIFSVSVYPFCKNGPQIIKFGISCYVKFDYSQFFASAY